MTKQDILTALETAATMLKAGKDPKAVAADLKALARDVRGGKK